MTVLNSSNPILVENIRGEVVESFHRGSFCVVDERGDVLWSEGDIQQVSFPRSALKYFQHIPFLLSGGFDAMGFTSKELAIMCASHNGEDVHLDVVNSVLHRISLNSDYLKCGAQQPTLKKDFLALVKADKEPSCMHNNCSGKHAGFLAYCVHEKLNLADYLSPSHPLHQQIKNITALFYETDESSLALGVDGCSAPIFGMPLINQALAYKNLVSPMPWKDSKLTDACNRIVEAVTQYPLLVAGSKRYCTDLMEVTKGRIVGKTGADGVYCLAIPHKKWGIAIKIDDGKMGPQYQVAQEILTKLNLITTEEAAQLSSHWHCKNTNFAGNHVGYSEVISLNPPQHILS
jgi:L-asparaginase II